MKKSVLKTVKIRIENDFHNTYTIARVEPDENGCATLSPSQVKRINRALCNRGCACSGALGQRGYQPDVDNHLQNEDGSFLIHLRGW